MNLTPEQQKIINSTGNIKINAVAGSGKLQSLLNTLKQDLKTAKYFTLFLTNP